MRKQLKTNGTKKARGRAWAKRVVSVLLAFAILPGMSGFIPAPAPSIVANSASAEASQSTALLFDGIANGTVMGDGVLIHYGVWDLAGMYEAAVSTGRYFTPGMIADALPFESDEVKAEFLAKYADGWYLVDQVYSKLLMPEWPGCIPELAEGEAESFMARSSAVYAVSRSGWQDVQFIVLGKNGEVFNIYVDADGTDAVKANIVEYAEAVEEIAEEPVTEPAGQQEQTLPAGAEEEGQPSDSAQPNEPAPESQPSAATLPAEQPEQATLPAGQPAGSAQGEPAAPEVGQGAETATPPATGQGAETATLPAAEQAAETAAQPDGQQPE
ncbi:MAG: hypothetical protein LBJ10_11295, partial [Clostridiales bacterium]|nr:hypothetical protein [Clostridiales bacterium]